MLKKKQKYDIKALKWAKDHGYTIEQLDNLNRGAQIQSKILNRNQGVKQLASFMPVTGEAMAAHDVYKNLWNKEYKQAALTAALLLLPNVVERPIKSIYKIGKRISKHINANQRVANAMSKNEKYFIDRTQRIVNEKDAFYRNKLNFIESNVKNRLNKIKVDSDDLLELKMEMLGSWYKAHDDLKKLKQQAKDEYKLPITDLKLFDVILKEDPNYILFSAKRGIPFDSKEAINAWVKKQNTAVRGVFLNSDQLSKTDAEIDEIIQSMLTHKKKSTIGGDRLNTDGGLYVSNSELLANRFSRSNSDDVTGMSVTGILLLPDIDTTLGIVDQLRLLRRRFSYTDDFVRTEDLVKLGFIGRQALYTSQRGDLLPSFETALFSNDYKTVAKPNTPIVKIKKLSKSTNVEDIKNINGRWGKHVSGANIVDDIYSPSIYSDSFGDFIRQARAIMPEYSKIKNRMLAVLKRRRLNEIEDEVNNIFNDKLHEFDTQHKMIENNRAANYAKLRAILDRIASNKNKIKKLKNSAIAIGATSAIGNGISKYTHYEHERFEEHKNKFLNILKLRNDSILKSLKYENNKE